MVIQKSMPWASRTITNRSRPKSVINHYLMYYLFEYQATSRI